MESKTANVLARDEMNQKQFDEMMSIGVIQAKNGESVPAEKNFGDLMKEISK